MRRAHFVAELFAMEARLEAQYLLHYVYCAAIHGDAMRRRHGELMGNAIAAAERYVNHELLPRCEELIEALSAPWDAMLDAVERPSTHLSADAELRSRLLPISEHEVAFAPVESSLTGGASSSSQLPEPAFFQPPTDVMGGGHGELMQDYLEACGWETPFWEATSDPDLDFAATPHLVHFVNMTGETLYSEVLRSSSSLQHVQDVINKQCGHLCGLGECWVLAERCLHGKLLPGAWHTGKKSKGPIGDLSDLDARRTDDGQMWVTVVKKKNRSFFWQ